MKNIEIGILGSGNVAHHLAIGLFHAGLPIRFICSRNVKKGKAIARATGAEWQAKVPAAKERSAVLFVCTSDDAIQDVMKKNTKAGFIMVHCSGSIGLVEGAAFPQGTGVFYPVQSFSSKLKVDWSEVPICLEASHPKALQLLKKIAKLLSRKVTMMNSRQRLMVHLAAVFANNFSNAQYAIAELILKENNLSFDLLRPLIAATAEKVQHSSPVAVQTGPAQREDQQSIKSHLALLKATPDIRNIYTSLTKFIIKNKNKAGK
ncbi:MAG: DUF2520 domain-containing protein [Bacteroidetes bacterium]|nr:DUF2520 domain-containing protein [Bacteroidota bacterium]